MAKITVYPTERLTLDEKLRKRFLALLRKRKVSKSSALREALIFYLDHLDAENRFLNKEGREA